MRRDSDCDGAVTCLRCHLHLLRQSPSTCVRESRSPGGGGGEDADADDVDGVADRNRPVNVVRRIGTVEQSVTRTDRQSQYAWPDGVRRRMFFVVHRKRSEA